MKKNPIIFIAMLIALAFTSCQMNTDDTGPNSGDSSKTTTTEATSYTVVYGEQTIGTGLTNTDVDNCILQFGLTETTDYSINKTTGIITLTDSGYEKVKPYLDNGKIPTTTTTEPTDTDDDTGGNTNPPATIEYTVSVADGIKGGHIEVSLDDKTWTKLSAPVKYEKKTNLYVRAQPANSFYNLKTLGFTLPNGESGYLAKGASNCITINANTTLNATFEIEKRGISTLSCTMTATDAITDDYKNSKYRIEIRIDKAKFDAGWSKPKIALGFDEEYYYGLTETNLANGPKYYYVFPIEISDFMKIDYLDMHLRFAFVGINGENFEMPEVGKLYLILENSNDNQTSLYPITNSNTSDPKFFSVAVTE